MEHLRDNGYETISLNEAIRFIQNKEFFPDKKFVITFDDGYKNIHSEALPILKTNNFKGPVFLVTDFC